jgi:hypothetical protein
MINLGITTELAESTERLNKRTPTCFLCVLRGLCGDDLVRALCALRGER